MTTVHLSQGINELASKTVRGHQLAATDGIVALLNALYQKYPEAYQELNQIKMHLDTLNMAMDHTRKLAKKVQTALSEATQTLEATEAQYRDLLDALITRDRKRKEVRILIEGLQADGVMDFGQDDDFTDTMLYQMASFMSDSYGHGVQTCYWLLDHMVNPNKPRHPEVEVMLEQLYDLRMGA